jgi:hypothetical protein
LDGDFSQAEPFGGNSQSPTGDHAAVHVDDDGKHEAELFDARLQLSLSRGFQSCVPVAAS